MILLDKSRLRKPYYLGHLHIKDFQLYLGLNLIDTFTIDCTVLLLPTKHPRSPHFYEFLLGPFLLPLEAPSPWLRVQSTPAPIHESPLTLPSSPFNGSP
jgi:hypothetical protein